MAAYCLKLSLIGQAIYTHSTMLHAGKLACSFSQIKLGIGPFSLAFLIILFLFRASILSP